VAVQLRLLDDETRLPPGGFAGMRLYRQGGGKEDGGELDRTAARRQNSRRCTKGGCDPLPPGTYRLEPVVPDLKDKLTAKAEGEVDGPTRPGAIRSP